MADEVPELTPQEAAARLRDEDGWQVVDVREAHEHASGAIAGDVLIPLGELSIRAGEIDPQRPALIYCRSGQRSAMAVAALRAAGYQAHNLAGGILAWTEAGLPVSADDGAAAVAGSESSATPATGGAAPTTGADAARARDVTVHSPDAG